MGISDRAHLKCTSNNGFYPSVLGLWYPFGEGTADNTDNTNGKGTATSSSNSDDPICGSSSGGSAEQPLDLSAKSSSSSCLEQKNIFK